MIKVDLNILSIAGLLFGAASLVLLLAGESLGDPTMESVFGEGAPFGKVALYMIFAFVGICVYLAGRVVWLLKNREV